MSFTDICKGHTIVPDQFVIRGDCRIMSLKIFGNITLQSRQAKVLSQSWVGFTH